MDETIPYILTLSSIPPRFPTIGAVLQSFLSQSARPSKVVLYIPKTYRRFPDYDGSLPDVPLGVEIRRPDVDYGPASKVLHAVEEFGDMNDGNIDLLFADDDLIYEPDWAARLLDARSEMPEAAICAHALQLEDLDFAPKGSRQAPRAERRPRWADMGYRLRKVATQIERRSLHLERHDKPWRSLVKRPGYGDIFEGYAGVLVKPRFFDRDTFDIPDVLWAVDDVWLSGAMARNGIDIWVAADATRFRYTPSRHTEALNLSVIDGANRDAANRLCVKYMQDRYGIWPAESAT